MQQCCVCEKNLPKIFPEAYNICQKFDISDNQMKTVIDLMSKEIKHGLAKDSHSRAFIKCYVTYIQDLPTGQEEGQYLALDLSSRQFRVMLVQFQNSGEMQIESSVFKIQSSLLTGPGEKLFDYIAKGLDKFMRHHHIHETHLSLGFTFSFPTLQEGLNKAVLIAWSKDFNCTDVVGHDVVKLLQEAMVRRHIANVNIAVVLNDTTGTLLSCFHTNQNCRIGVLVDADCTACYVEKTINSELFEDHQTSTKPNMIINCDWSTFGDNGSLDFLRTDFDRTLDDKTVNMGKQTFEKFIAGTYLGELVRLITVELIKKGVLFKGIKAQLIHVPWKFQTNYIFEIENDIQGTFSKCSAILEKFEIRKATEKDMACLRYICETISRRSAKLLSCGLVCLINKVEIDDVCIGIDGSIYRHHPKYHIMLMEYITKLLDSKSNFELMLTDDGAGRGAALAAASIQAMEDSLMRLFKK